MEMLYTCTPKSLREFLEGYDKWQRNKQVIHPELDEKYRRIEGNLAFRLVIAEVTMLSKMGVVPCVSLDNKDNETMFYHDIICWCRRYYNGKDFA